MATPILKQYLEIKSKHPDELLLFRMGDFYELFYDDAKIASEALGIVLTSKPLGKNLRVPLAGIPVKAAESYISKLLSKGYKVAICEQTGEGKGLMTREVVEVITPGTILTPSLLNEKSHHYIASVVERNNRAYVAFADLTTGDFKYFSSQIARAIDELSKLEVKEVISPKELDGNFYTSIKPPSYFQSRYLEEELKEFFGVSFLELEEKAKEIKESMYGLISYLKEKKGDNLPSFSPPVYYPLDDFLYLDPRTIKNLELIETIYRGEGKSLIEVLDETQTPMGARFLKETLISPPSRKDRILERQNIVEALLENMALRTRLDAILKKIGDIERLATRAVTNKASPKEVLKLGKSLEEVSNLKLLLMDSDSLKDWGLKLPDLLDLSKEIVDTLVEDPPSSIGEGGVIRDGISKELDEIRELARRGKEKILELEKKEREKTGISSLKIGYNSVFGYYIEVTKPNLKKVPPNYIRKQTLTNAERFITDELKDLESKILGAEERMIQVETAIYRTLLNKIKERGRDIKKAADIIAELDMDLSFAKVAIKRRYVRPIIRDDGVIKIEEGRHPVVEIVGDEPFVPNDAFMDNEERRVFIVTGPNMAGKSTYLRQVALIVILAHMGSFVPAKRAEISLVDRIFTRIGASDDLSRGVSTFMAEMLETSQILRSATEKSLIILDEVGRGTSTYDGMAIAWAVVEYITEKLKAKTLFATHYHELAELSRKLKGVKNLTVLVKEWEDRIIFLRKVVEGESDRSYGIHVAKLAGLPEEVIDRAGQVLKELERRRNIPQFKGSQLSLFKDEGENHLRKKLQSINLDTLTPIEALNLLYKLKEEIEK